MKNLIVLAMLCLAVGLNAGDKAAREKHRKMENKKRAEKYRKYAADYKTYKLSKCYEKSDGGVLASAKEVVRLKKKLGEHFENLAKAFEKDDQEAVKKLYDEKWELERTLELADKRREPHNT